MKKSKLTIEFYDFNIDTYEIGTLGEIIRGRTYTVCEQAQKNGEFTIDWHLSFFKENQLHQIKEIFVNLYPEPEASSRKENTLRADADKANQPYASIDLFIPRRQFEAIKDSRECWIKIEARIPMEKRLAQPIHQITDVDVFFMEFRNRASNIPMHIFEKKLHAWVKEPQSRSGIIAMQMATYLIDWFNENRFERRDLEKYYQRIIDLICNLRKTFWGGKNRNPVYLLNAEEFEAAIQSFEEESISEAIFIYENIWKHRDSSKIYKCDETVSSLSALVDVDAVQDFAEAYINTSWMHSTELEWVLMDALMYTDSLKFNMRDNHGLADGGLLSAIAHAYDNIKTSQFNAQLLRELLYDATKRGMLYNPFIFHLLDRAIIHQKSASF